MVLRLFVRGLSAHRFSYQHLQPLSTIAAPTSAEQLLQDSDLQSLLKRHSKTAQDPVDGNKDLRLELLSYFARRTGRPVASNALGKMKCAEEMAAWYASEMRPCRAKPHARRLISATLGDAEGKIDEKIDLEKEVVQEQLMRSLPANLELDPKTFVEPAKFSLKVQAFRRPYIDQKNERKARKAKVEEERRVAAGW